MLQPKATIFGAVLAAVLFTAKVSSQVYVPAYGAVVEQCSAANILQNLTEFQALGVKFRGTTAQANALTWLKNKYLSYGYTAAQLVEDTYSYSGSSCKNLIVTKTGTLYPNIFVIVDGHYDTVVGPGTNDNGSGTAVILEMARLLQSIPTEYSVRFINFSGEEDGLMGSQHYVSSVVNGTTPKMNIRLVFNLDEVGGVAGETNDSIMCERDLSSPTSNNAQSSTMTTQLMNCVELYSPLNAILSYAYASDYMPFQSNNEIITGFYEANESPYPHSVNDVLSNMDPEYVHNVAKAAIGATMHFAVACTTCSLGNEEFSARSFDIFPNPAQTSVTIVSPAMAGQNYSYELINMLGSVVRKGVFTEAVETENIDISGITTGIYSLRLRSDGNIFTKKLIIQ